MEDLKLEYNRLIKRFKKAEKYLESVTWQEGEKWLPELKKITDRLSYLIDVFKSAGYRMSYEEILNGFKE